MISFTLERRHRSNASAGLRVDLLSTDRGVATIEYTLVAGLIAIAALFGVSELGSRPADQWGGIHNEAGNAL